jgi:hypothetical protein
MNNYIYYIKKILKKKLISEFLIIKNHLILNKLKK